MGENSANSRELSTGVGPSPVGGRPGAMPEMNLRRATAFFGASGVAAAAFGAHGLQKIADPEQMRWWAIAAALQLVTAPVALFACQQGARARLSAGLLLGGVTVFSGSLYLMSLGAPRFLGAVTPLGGLLLIAGWLALGWPTKKID